MANSAELLINIRAQNQQALRSLDRVNRAVNQMNRNTTRGLRGATKEAKNFNNVLATTAKRIGAFFIVRGAGKLLGEMGRLSSSAEEVQTRYDTVMGEMKDETDKMVESAVKNLGLLRQELQDTVSVVQNIANSMGFSAKESGVFSRAITSLSADMTSFFDLPFSEAFRALKSGLVGETEPLRRLGILTTENALANFAMVKGIDKSIRKMTEQEKMVLRLVAITEQSKSSQGDLGKTLGSSANMFRVMVSRVKELGTTLGWFITEALAPVVKWIIVIVQAMNAFFSSIKEAKEAVKETTEAIDNGKAIANMADEQENLTDNMDKTTKAMKANLQGFDELNTISDNTDLSSGMGELGKLSPEFEALLGDLDYKDFLAGMEGRLDTILAEAKADVETFMSLFDENLNISNLVTSFSELGTALKDMAENESVQALFGLLIKISGLTLEFATDSLTIAVDLFTNLVELFDAIIAGDIKGVFRELKDIFGNLEAAMSLPLKNFGGFLGMLVLLDIYLAKKAGVSALFFARYQLHSIPKEISNKVIPAMQKMYIWLVVQSGILKGKFLSAVNSARLAIIGFAKNVYNFAKSLITTAISAITTFVKAVWKMSVEIAKKAITALVSFAKNIFNVGKAFLIANAKIILITASILGLVALLVYAWQKSDKFREIVTYTWEAIRFGALMMWEGLKWVFYNLVAWLKYDLKGAMESFGFLVKAVWSAVGMIIETAWEFIKSIFGAIIRFVTILLPKAFWNIVKGAELAFKALFNTVVFVWNKIVEAVEFALNALVKNFDMVIDGVSAVAKALGFDIPEFKVDFSGAKVPQSVIDSVNDYSIANEKINELEEKDKDFLSKNSVLGVNFTDNLKDALSNNISALEEEAKSYDKTMTRLENAKDRYLKNAGFAEGDVSKSLEKAYEDAMERVRVAASDEGKIDFIENLNFDSLKEKVKNAFSSGAEEADLDKVESKVGDSIAKTMRDLRNIDYGTKATEFKNSLLAFSGVSDNGGLDKMIAETNRMARNITDVKSDDDLIPKDEPIPTKLDEETLNLLVSGLGNLNKQLLDTVTNNMPKNFEFNVDGTTFARATLSKYEEAQRSSGTDIITRGV